MTIVTGIHQQLDRRDPGELVEEDEEMGSAGDDDDGSSEEDEEESSGEVEPNESNSEEGDEVANQVRKKIEDALKADGVDVGEDDSQEDSEEELMDDDQMMALDDTLANIFRTRVNGRKSKKGLQAPFSNCFC